MKNVIKTIVFFIILFILLVIISRIFIPKNNTDDAGLDSYGRNQILGEKDNTVDLMVLGNSESFTSIIPMKLWEDCGYTSYICGNPGQVLPDSMQILYELSQKQDFKVVVLEANVIYEDGPLTLPATRVLYHVLPISKYHDRWKSLQIRDFDLKEEYTSTDPLKGYFHRADGIKPADATGYMAYSDGIFDISKRGKLYLKIMNEYCKANDIKFIIMSVPSTVNWNYEKHNGMQKFCDEEGIEFIDFNMLTDKLEIDWNKDTLDGGDHMNIYGSIKLTDYFEEYLSENNLLQSHKDDSSYSKWNEDLEDYKKIYGEKHREKKMEKHKENSV